MSSSLDDLTATSNDATPERKQPSQQQADWRAFGDGISAQGDWAGFRLTKLGAIALRLFPGFGQAPVAGADQMHGGGAGGGQPIHFVFG